MWLKLLLLTLYLVFLFILTRILEAASWYHGYQSTGKFLSSFTALDPITLSVKKLKQYLDFRGVSYSVVGKQELIELVEATGKPTSEELADDEDEAEVSAETTQFSCGSHFYEEVEDTKDSAWLVQVVVDDDEPPLLSTESWNEVVSKVIRFGVRTGVFRCSLDKRLCSRKGWTSHRLILALPRGQKAKEDVVLHNYIQPSSAVSVLQWVRKHLASRVKEIKSLEEFEKWFKYSNRAKMSEIRVVFLSVLKSCPMFLSSLAIKFNGRVKFGTVDVSKNESYKKALKSVQFPAYLVITPEKTFVYGSKKGECYNFKCLELYLKTFVPETNDIFLWSLLFVNSLASFELFFMYSQIWRHFLLYIVCVIKYNCILFLMWMLILGLYQFPFMLTCTDTLLKCLRFVSGSNTASLIRNDYRCYYSYTFVLATFVTFASVAGYILRKYRWVQEEEYSLLPSWWFNPWDGLISPYFFRPISTLTRTSNAQDLDLEEGTELLIERLATPNLWLQPVISTDYIKELPLWKYRGWCEADDAVEDNRNEVLYSSDDESANITTVKLVVENIVPSKQTSFENPCTGERFASLAVNAISSPFICDKGSHMKDVSCTCSLSSTSVVSNPKMSDKSPKEPDTERAPRGMLEFRECSICLESYHYGDVLCGLPCGHNFHANCIMMWLSRDNHVCPICRWPSYKPKSRIFHSHLQ